MEERTTGDQKNPAGSAGARQGEGAALPFPRDKLQKKPPWAEPRTKKGSRDQRKKCRARGKRSVTLTMLHAKKSWILWSSTASDLCLHCRRPAAGGGLSPGASPYLAAAGAVSVVQPQAGAVPTQILPTDHLPRGPSGNLQSTK